MVCNKALIVLSFLILSDLPELLPVRGIRKPQLWYVTDHPVTVGQHKKLIKMLRSSRGLKLAFFYHDLKDTDQASDTKFK